MNTGGDDDISRWREQRRRLKVWRGMSVGRDDVWAFRKDECGHL